MSMPGNKIYCTGCDFEQYIWHKPHRLLHKMGSDVVTYYPRISWCYECDHIVRAEGIPSEKEIKAEIEATESKESLLILQPWIEDHRKTADIIRERICRNQGKSPTLHCFYCNSQNVSIQGEWIVCEDCKHDLPYIDIPCVLAIDELLLNSDKKASQKLEANAKINRRVKIRELRTKLQWRRERIAPPHCLTCGSANIAYLSFSGGDAQEVSVTRRIDKNFMHSCGGSFVWASDLKSSLRIAFRHMATWIDIDGNVIKHEDISSYDWLNHDQVCPKPNMWQKILKLLMNKKKKGSG